MGADVTTEPKAKKKAEVSPEPAAASPSGFGLEAAYGTPAGMPLFLGIGLQRKLAVGAVDDPLIRTKCAKCQEKDEEEAWRVPAVQAKCACCGGGPCRHDSQGRGHDSQPARIHSTARDGVASASQPLPHLDRIQASFGRHDVSAARAAIGGPAAQANES